MSTLLSRAAGEQATDSVLKFNEPLSWTPGNTISEGELLRRLQALHAELGSQPQSPDLLEALRPVAAELINERLLKHRSKSVKSWTICCIVEVVRHSCPNAPFTGRQLKVSSSHP
jgi:sister chromatid cohesion protein PDS5